jgi:branched-chain amino acid transport system permease protein
MQLWVVHLLNGISFGALLFILSSGFTLALGMMQIINIAHGAFYLLSAYMAWTMWQLTGNFLLTIVVSILPSMIIGIMTQKWLLRKLYLQPLPQVLLTMGMALIIAESGSIVWGGYPRVMGQPPWLAGATQLGPVFFPTYRLFIMAVAAGVAIFLWSFLEKTRVGAFIRACVDDEEMSRGMGVNVTRLFTYMFGFTCLLAGLGGVIGAPFLGAYQGAEFEVLLLALVVVVLGGLGSLRGALVASVLIGILDSLGKGFFPELAHFTLFAPMIIVLAVRPTGLMGKA